MCLTVLLKPIKKKAGMVDNSILGDASEKAVLERAGINKAPAVVITSHNDESNMYLTIYCRKLRPTSRLSAGHSFIEMWNLYTVQVQTLSCHRTGWVQTPFSIFSTG